MSKEHSGSEAWLQYADGNRTVIRGSCSLGRSASNQIVLPDERVSRRHAIVHAQEGTELWLVDLGSRNGTYLNGRRIVQPTRLQHMDQIGVGPFTLSFHQPRCCDSLTTETMAIDRTVAEIRPCTCWLAVADIIDSSRLMREMPADELPVLTGEWLAECKQTIEEFGGGINQFLGDGFLAYWHEREGTEVSVQRALDSLRRLQAQGSPPFRFVAHRAQVFIGGASLGEERLTGMDVHLVFRMEKLAAGLGETRLLSEAAWERLEGLIEARDIGEHPLPGFEGRFRFYAF